MKIGKQYEVWEWPVDGGKSSYLLAVFDEDRYDEAVVYATRRRAPGAYIKEFHFPIIDHVDYPIFCLP